MKEFYRRTLTGAWIVIFILGGFWLHPVTFCLTGLVIMSGILYEYYRIINGSGTRVQTVTGMVTGIAVYLLSILIAAGLLEYRFFLLVIPLIAMIMTAELYRRDEKPFDSLAHTFFGLIYAVVPFSLFPFSAFSRSGIKPIIPCESIDFSPGMVVGFFILLWINDTGACVTGMTMGKHRLMERISPKKSWEGFIGGTVLTALTASLLSSRLGILDSAGWVVVALIVAISGTYGDLIESMLKRSTGIKDSGSIMPGHGGFMDRFDSTMLAFPLVFLFISLFG
ncbi:MAG TPA: phosphatidate cytidylyltransferase [Bacteroidales bacterium]|nr:phosphatidate cytidylyltransferase [Bacteroidales bacterium]